MEGLTRRALMMQGLCGCGWLATGALAAPHVDPAALRPLVQPGYEPADADERGLWQQCEQLEYEIASSNLRIRDSGISAYVAGVANRLLGGRDFGVRTYLVRDADFNASMFPNGMMIVNTGLLARMRNEAQLAAVLGHECGHYLRRHSLQNFRSVKAKSAALAVVGVAAAGAAGSSSADPFGGWLDIANGVSVVLVLSVFSFSRDQESEADAYGIALLGESGYPPSAAAEVWAQLIAERKASATARNKRFRDPASSVLSTHPPSEARMKELSSWAGEGARARAGLRAFDDRRAAWLAAVAPLRTDLLQEQIRQNDFGASLYLVESFAADGWSGTLRYFEGEAYRLRGSADDTVRAATAYRAAIAYPDAPPEAWRAHGYALLKAGEVEDGRRALSRYLELKPDAVDAAMVQFTLAQ